jgi:hypothetical protein
MLDRQPRGEANFTCMADACGAWHQYEVKQIAVSLYTHGICTLAFTCLTCGERSEFAVFDRVAIMLDEMGAPTTIVHTPDEVLEWPAREVPRLTQHDAEVFERSSLRHLEECRRRELVDIPGDSARLEGS